MIPLCYLHLCNETISIIVIIYTDQISRLMCLVGKNSIDLSFKRRWVHLVGSETTKKSRKQQVSRGQLVIFEGRVRKATDAERGRIARGPSNKLTRAQTPRQARRRALLGCPPFTRPAMTERWTGPIEPLPGNHSQTFGLTPLWRFSRPCIMAARSLGRQVKTSIVATVGGPSRQLADKTLR